MNDWYNMSAAELIEGMKAGSIGVEELTRGFLQRIEKYNGALNAVCEIDEAAPARARELDGRGADRSLPLFGLPVLVKDNIDVKGLHTTAGSLALDDNIASRDADVITRLRENGAIILGKTNMTEFANYTTQDMPGGYSSRGGQVKNAYGSDFEASGSSTGSAVAMSAGLCGAAVGTDTSFSVVGCATNNGVTGLKPPMGALSQRGIIPIAHTLDSAGALTRDFADAMLLINGMRDKPIPPVSPIAPDKLRIAVNAHNRETVSEEQMGKYDILLDALRSDGAKVTSITNAHSPQLKTIMQYEFKHDLEQYLAQSNAKRKTLREIVEFYERDPERMMRYGIVYLRAALEETSGQLDDEVYLDAMRKRELQRAQLMSEIDGYDACVMTGPTNIMHLAGMPSLALKLGMAKNGAPRGVILYGADERRLYAAAMTIEKYTQPVTPPRLSI